MITSALCRFYELNPFQIKNKYVKKKSLEQIATYEKKLSVARNLLVTEKIDAEDYNIMKTEYNEIINSLEKEMGNMERTTGRV